MEESPKTIKLNIGGRIFESTPDTLNKSEFLRALIQHKNTFSEKDDKVIFIDRSPSAFKHVLELLRNVSYNFPDKYAHEIEFYGIKIEKSAEPETSDSGNVLSVGNIEFPMLQQHFDDPRRIYRHTATTRPYYSSATLIEGQIPSLDLINTTRSEAMINYRMSLCGMTIFTNKKEEFLRNVQHIKLIMNRDDENMCIDYVDTFIINIKNKSTNATKIVVPFVCTNYKLPLFNLDMYNTECKMQYEIVFKTSITSEFNIVWDYNYYLKPNNNSLCEAGRMIISRCKSNDTALLRFNCGYRNPTNVTKLQIFATNASDKLCPIDSIHFEMYGISSMTVLSYQFDNDPNSEYYENDLIYTINFNNLNNNDSLKNIFTIFLREGYCRIKTKEPCICHIYGDMRYLIHINGQTIIDKSGHELPWHDIAHPNITL